METGTKGSEKIGVASGVILLLACSLARADANASREPKTLGYDDAVELALHDNVDLLAIREQEETLKAQARQALAPNEPVFIYNKIDVPTFSLTDTAAQVYYQVNWTLGFPGKALSQSSSLSSQSEASAHQARTEELTLRTSLSNSYVAFAVNAAFHKFLLDEQKSNQALIGLIKKRYAASQASKVDLLNAEVATQQIAQAILQNRNDYEIQLTQFRQLIRRPAETWLLPKIPDTIEIPDVVRPLEDLRPVMLRNNSAIASAQSQLDSASSLVTNAALQALPDLQLSGGYNAWIPGASPNTGLLHDYTLGLGVSVPLFFAFNELQGIQAARHTRASAENQLTSQQLQAEAGLQTAYASYRAALLDLDASERLVVPAARASFELTLLTYGYGKADYLIVAASRKALHDAERDRLTKRQTAAQFYNQLIAQLGCDISRSEGPYVCK
jgi:outer membrane protein TolC